MNTITKIEPRSRLTLGWNELWSYRELLFFFAWKDVKVKYKQAALGVLWTVLQPLILMSIFVLFLAKGLSAPTDNIPAPVFYFSGLLIWNLFSSAISTAANSMVTNANIIKKIYFPRLIIPFAGVAVSSFDFLISLALFFILAGYYVFIGADLNLIALVPVLVLSYGLAVSVSLGVGSMLAAWNVKYRDFRYVVPFLLQMLFFLTPVIYPVSVISKVEYGSHIMAVNPVSSAIEITRKAMLGESIWSIELLISCISAVLMLTIGLWVFKRSEAYFADIV